MVLKDPTCTAGGLTLAFNPMYSAYDGKHTFQLPAVVYGTTSKVTWFADSNLVFMMANSERDNEVLLQMRKAGDTVIHVQSEDGKCGSAPLHITAAKESDWEIGNMRYNDGLSVHLSGMPNAAGVSPLELSGTGGPACTNCHGETATGGPFTNVSHTPEQTGGFSDEEILNIVLHGMWPAGDQFDWSIVPQPAWMMFHQWSDITTDQQTGIIVYLRSLTPRPQLGAPNFNAFDSDAAPPPPPDFDAASIATEDGGSDAASE
jgi:hypothetical protein